MDKVIEQDCLMPVTIEKQALSNNLELHQAESIVWVENDKIPELLKKVSDLFIPEKGISNNSNSEFGSHHWLHTLMGFIKRTGSFIEQHGNSKPDDETLKKWGAQIVVFSQEILDYYTANLKASPTTTATGSAITSERLEEMSKDVDKALESETPESLQQFMDSQRTPATSWEEVYNKAQEHAVTMGSHGIFGEVNFTDSVEATSYYQNLINYLSQHWPSSQPVSPTPMSETWEESKLARMVIEVLENKARYCCDSVSWKGYQNGNGTEVGVDIDKVIRYAKSIINSAPSLHQVDRWVRVEDGLPEENVEVLCWQPERMDVYGKPVKGRVLAGRLFSLRKGQRDGNIDLDKVHDKAFPLLLGGTFWAFPYICHPNFVTHWQPLPAAPETDKTT